MVSERLYTRPMRLTITLLAFALVACCDDPPGRDLMEEADTYVSASSKIVRASLNADCKKTKASIEELSALFTRFRRAADGYGIHDTSRPGWSEPTEHAWDTARARLQDHQIRLLTDDEKRCGSQ